MNPRRRHKAKARRATRGRATAQRTDGVRYVEMRPRTGLLVLPTWWHVRMQQCIALGIDTVRIRAGALGWDTEEARTYSMSGGTR